MLTFDLSVGNAWQPLNSLWASPGHYDHSANSMIDINGVQLTQSITNPLSCFSWVYDGFMTDLWCLIVKWCMRRRMREGFRYCRLSTAIRTYWCFLLLLASLGLRKSRRAQGRDAQNAEVTGCSRLSRQGEQWVWCVVNYSSVLIESRDISHHIQISPFLTCSARNI